MKKKPRLSLACLFAVAAAAPAQAGFLDAVVNAGAGLVTQGGGAVPQIPVPQIDHAMIERMANELMDSLGVPAKTKNAKRAEVVKKLEALQMAQCQMQSVPVAAMTGAAGGQINQAMQLAQAVGGMQQGGGGLGSALAMLGGGNANQAAQLAQAVGAMQQGGGGMGGALAMVGGVGGNGGNAAKALQVATFLSENPDLVNQLMAKVKQGGSSADFSSSLNAVASRMAAKNPKGAQIVKFMADNPELTKQVLSLAGQTVSSAAGSEGGIMGSIKGIFGGSGGGDTQPPAAQAATGDGGGLFGGLKGMLQSATQGHGGESSSQPASTFGGDSGF